MPTTPPPHHRARRWSAGHRTHLATIALVTALTACGSDPKRSQEAAVDAALTAIVGGDPGDFAAVTPSAADLRARCPAMVEAQGDDRVEAQLAALREDVARRIAQCAELDWTDARRTAIVGGAPFGPMRDCEGLDERRDLEATYDVADGRVEVTLRAPVSADGWFAFTAAPRCRHRAAPAP